MSGAGEGGDESAVSSTGGHAPAPSATDGHAPALPAIDGDESALLTRAGHDPSFTLTDGSERAPATEAEDELPYSEKAGDEPASAPNAENESALAAQAGDDPVPAHHRRIRSFVTRAGRTSPAQQRARDTLGDRYVVPYVDRPLDYSRLFGREAPVVLEIGFGMGAATAEIAEAHRDVDFLGIEVHSPGVGALLKLVGESELTNLRIVEHDAVEVIERMIAPTSLAGVLVWFPDPWHKARHNKRRLIQPAFVSMLAGKLKADGFIHLATDWEEYAVQMLDVLGNETGLLNRAEGFGSAENGLLTRPVTKFEKRGKRLGHGVWDLVFGRQVR